MTNKPEETHQVHHQPTSASSSAPYQPADDNVEKWGTHVMGHPAVPSSHPNNQKAAFWSGTPDHHPYVQFSPVDKPTKSPMESVVDVFNSWTNKAETIAHNIWQNLKTGPSVYEAVWGKVGLTAKAISGGGFESLYKQTFNTVPNEKLKKTFACYLSTSTGPVAGTLYLSNIHIAFCSDRPLTFTAPSGQQAWSYYKVMIPLAMVRAVNPVSMKENPSERYIQINTVDGHEFWFMGFVNYEKASVYLSESLSEFVAHQMAAQTINH
ncbi:GRAM domain [Macleaya cordata]|uniref:GRAM domain n=1 Tax=Macleaya cordata TaxID=56857 RepID=A0A200R3W1_MACCD|nr:GRAM domain [Macleaya cordata]